MNRTFAEAAYNRYKNENVEIFTGNQTGIQLYNDFQAQEQATIAGKLIGVDGDMLIVETTVVTPERSFKCEVLVNCFHIETIIKQSYNVGLLTIYGGHTVRTRKR